MSVRRALVDCAVLSVQDARVFYPCCKGCFSRIDVEQQDATRYRCSKCGYSCVRERVDYRYRLSLRVTRDRCIFGVTVFGTCLNPFFGIHASGLQRLVENTDLPVGATTRASLLMKAVEDCFIGRHFIFGIKVTGTESGLWFGGPLGNGSSSKDTVQFIASQMILPKATGLSGCTVVSYYRILLQKAAEYKLGSTDPSKTSRPPETTLLLITHQSPATSFNNTTLSASGLLSPSPQRSQHQDSTLTPTPPWQQSLGLVTSSAEQEERCSTQVSEDENSQQTDNNKTLHHVHRGFLENHKVTEERTLSALLSLENSSYSSPSFAKYPHTSVVENTPILNTWLTPSQPVQKRDLPLGSKTKGFSTKQLTKTCLSSSFAWEDLPFSESLSEFLCEEKDFNIISEIEPHLNVQNQNEPVRTNLEIRSEDNNSSIESTSVCESNTKITITGLLDITNTPALTNGGERHGLSDQLCKNSVGCVNKSQSRSICFHQCDQEDEEASSLSFENKEEQLEEDPYDFSADLFSCSLMIDMNSKILDTHAGTDTATTEASSLLSSPDKQHPRTEKTSVPHSTPVKQKLKSNKCINRDSFIPPGAQDLDFIPPAQSTPIVKVAVVSGSPVSSYFSSTLSEFSSQPDSQDFGAFYSDLPEIGSKKQTQISPSLCELKTVGAKQLPRCGRESTKENWVYSTTSSRHKYKSTPKRFWKPNKHKNLPPDQQHLRVQRGALNLGSRIRINHKCDSSICDVTVCDHEDNYTIVPPTPAKTRLSVKLRRRQADNSSNLVSTLKVQQGDGVNCKRNVLDQHPSSLTSSQRGLAQTGNCDSEIVNEGSLDGSNGYLFDDMNQTCDWSRDLFSNSI
ncbi:DNA damage-induced apoptosis suppressor protein [Seriola lalandi dorsalis]|uniref:DNA damage induced apoptosis suppressor n=1 Tax=Seriola lalandi dorsalis TaxID=1841481 RepID=A0A3B4WP66_SERLL|nr:DNA damage-induced apoptosis suppressor protein [Seriola lalandi dorsalis]